MKAKRLLIVAAMAAAVASCEWLPSDENEAKRELRKRLVDPDSAKFESLVKNSETGAICGFFNSKNRMGGYVGLKPFFYKKDGGATIVQEPPDERDFERFFERIRYVRVEEYLALEDRCNSQAQWEKSCGTKIFPTRNKYCELVIQGESMEALYELAKPSLRSF